jgi:solute:Na+ symporter, SSS family
MMITLSYLDIIIIISFFTIVLFTGFWAGRKTSSDADDYLLSGRKVGLILFVFTNVSTWYGGILGVGEFTYLYGIASWFTQGFPYYIFAFLFALFFAKKIRAASLFTIPDKITETYGRTAGLLTAVFVFVLVSPAPYLLMVGNLLKLIFGLSILPALLLGVFISMAYLLKGGFKADLYTDVIQFVVMFAGFFILFYYAFITLGDYSFLTANLPETHLQLTGGASPLFITVWFLIALWTFADPGFHQRCYAAKTGTTAVKGIIISIFFWALFDFLTTATGLYARASLTDLAQPVLAFPLLAEQILPSGWKGIFYAAMFATIMSTLNSFLFLSGTTIGRDFIFKLKRNSTRLKVYTIYGLIASGILSIILAYLIPSVIEIWYLIGSFCIPAIILPVISSYYPRIKISKNMILFEMIAAFSSSILWYILKDTYFAETSLSIIEPMLVGLLFAVIIHFIGVVTKKK